jgi:secreted trypsin-like serine protease
MAALLALVAGPAAGITHGEPDGDEHPHVGLLVFDVDGAPAWRCSGTLLSPTVMLTAGHCTFGTSGGRVWFESDATDTAATGYPFPGGTSVEFSEIHTHPDYVDEAFYLFDVGVAILSEPVASPRYGELADVGFLDGLATGRGLQNQQFTPVGYGIQSIVPEEQIDLVRYQATVRLIDVNGTAGVPAGASVTFTNSPGEANKGGTCFGDSGGPVFVKGTDVIAAVTSFGLNANCVGLGGGYRVDTADDQAFINQFLD